ncbi:MAG: hypothetical protein CMM91_06150 [Rickettsiales bacterium]|nr:hypothetical protein [Rickettsiales bacterium]
MIGTGGELPGSGTEDTQVADFINRRFQQAFDQSPIWPRYFVNSEARDIISLIISGLGAGSSTDFSSFINGNYILLGQDDGTNGAVAGTNVYYNTAVGTRSSNAVTNTAVIYKRSSTNRWEIEYSSLISIGANGSISVNAASGSTILFEADTQKKDKPSEVITWTLTTTLVSGTPLVVDEQLIPYAQTGKDTIGDFNRIHRKRAFLNNSAIEYEFFVDLNGANILNIASTTDNEAFVSYKKQFTPFTVTSDFYNSTVEVPGEFFNFIAHAVYADFLRVQNRQQEAIAEEQVAQTYLALELEKIDIRSNNNTVNKRFSTYVNRQSR